MASGHGVTHNTLCTLLVLCSTHTHAHPLWLCWLCVVLIDVQVSCKSLAGQSYEAAAAVLACAAAEALACCPGLLLLDDLDLLTPAPNTEGPTGLEQV